MRALRHRCRPVRCGLAPVFAQNSRFWLNFDRERFTITISMHNTKRARRNAPFGTFRKKSWKVVAPRAGYLESEKKLKLFAKRAHPTPPSYPVYPKDRQQYFGEGRPTSPSMVFGSRLVLLGALRPCAITAENNDDGVAVFCRDCGTFWSSRVSVLSFSVRQPRVVQPGFLIRNPAGATLSWPGLRIP
jgi:hypothetical protein